jgi:hypothetical protein
MSTSTDRQTLDLPDLRARIQGRVVGPEDSDYDEVRTTMYGDPEARPVVVVRPVGDDDVVQVVTLARETGLPLAVRSGGHSGAGHSSCDGGIVLDLRDLTDIDVDVDARTVWAGTGLTAADLTVATAEHGLAVGFGDTGSVGIGGITLGGGVGYLARKHGLTIDNLLAADVVTADGEVRRVDAESDPELFWAIRGGGGNLGVATRLQFRLHEVDQVLGGILVLPATAETVAGFVALAEAAPDELSTIANVMNCPSMPLVPEEHHGSVVILAMVCWAGDLEAGVVAMAPFRALAEPLADLVRPVPYPEMFPPGDPDYHPTAVSRTMFTSTVDLATAARVVDQLAASDSAMRVVQIRVVGGAVARVPADATAYAHRNSRLMVNVAAFYDGPDDRDDKEAWMTGLASDLHQGDDGAYVNFLGDEGPDRVRAAYPGATWDRLVAAKAAYDPDNLFRRNQNVLPTDAA